MQKKMGKGLARETSMSAVYERGERGPDSVELRMSWARLKGCGLIS